MAPERTWEAMLRGGRLSLGPVPFSPMAQDDATP